MYTSPPESFDELIAPFPASVRQTAEWLRAMILEEFPALREDIYGGKKVGNALYSVGSSDRVALGIQPGKGFVKVFVHDPEHLPPSPFKLEGSGKHSRHVKFDATPDDRREALISLLRIPVDRRS